VANAVIFPTMGLSRHKLNLRIVALTADKIAFRAVLEKGPEANFLREMIRFAAERVMQLATKRLYGPAPDERTSGRLAGMAFSAHIARNWTQPIRCRN
jgi:hypothetical protein